MTIRIGIVGAGLGPSAPTFPRSPICRTSPSPASPTRTWSGPARSPPGSASLAPSATTGPSSISVSMPSRSWRPTTCTTRWPPPPGPGSPRPVREAAGAHGAGSRRSRGPRRGGRGRHQARLRVPVQPRAPAAPRAGPRRLRGPRPQPRGLQPEPPSSSWIRPPRSTGRWTGRGRAAASSSSTARTAWTSPGGSSARSGRVCANARTVVSYCPATAGRRAPARRGGRRGAVARDAGGRRREHVPLELGVDRSALGDLAVFGDRGALVWRRRDDAWPFADLLGATAAAPTLAPLALPGALTAGLEWPPRGASASWGTSRARS